MSRRDVTAGASTATPDRSPQTQIPLGTYYDSDHPVIASYDPVADVVHVTSEENGVTDTLDPAAWLASSEGQATDQVAGELRYLFQAGDLLGQPECADDGCRRRLTPVEIDHSGQSSKTDVPLCKCCLGARYESWEAPPWVVPEDRTVDRRVVTRVVSAGEE